MNRKMIMIEPSGQLHEECFEDKKRPDVDTLRKTLGILTGDFYGVEEQIKQGKTREAAIRWDIYLHGYLNENGATGKTY